MVSVTILAIAILSLSFLLKYLTRTSRKYPPGPKGLPFLGVAKEHPKSEFWKTYAQWGKKYGDNGIISFHVLGRRILVINSAEVAEELLNKRSAIYSDRPSPLMACQLLRREKSVIYSPYNDRLKTYRRLMQRSFNQTAVQNYWAILEYEARTLANGIFSNPGELSDHIRRNSAAVMMKIAYGYTIEKNDDYFVGLAEQTVRISSLSSAPGQWLVDSFPILRHVPTWFPGASFKRKAEEWRHQLNVQALAPFEYVKRELTAGTAVPSFTSELLTREGGSSSEMDDIIIQTAGVIYVAGADTTVASVEAFFLAMTIHPEFQKRAQAEVDSLMAREHRLPTLRDRTGGTLPFLGALLKEVLRWSAAAPMAIPHATSADDVYRGWFIPAHTTILPNVWAMLNDERVYPHPNVFDPARFLGEDGVPVQRDPREMAFGFGRRVCPGQYIAESSVWIQMATALATLDIHKAVDEQGREIEPEVEFTTGLVSHVKPFQLRITPRSMEAVALVEQAIAAEQ